jgi:hypothetical protein
MSYRVDHYVEFWDAINAVVVASGGSAENTSVARQKAVVRVEKALADLCKANREPLVLEVIRLFEERRAGKKDATVRSIMAAVSKLAEFQP